MKKVTGQSLRFGGMFIEMLGAMGIMTGKGDIESLRLRLPDGTRGVASLYHICRRPRDLDRRHDPRRKF